MTQNAGEMAWAQRTFRRVSPLASVDLYFLDGGYCGVQPVNLRDGDEQTGRVNVCAMVRADVASTLPEVFDCHPGLQKRSRGWRPLSEPVTTSPLVFREPQPERDGILMAGDAAGFVDPFVGDGISLALRSGTSGGRVSDSVLCWKNFAAASCARLSLGVREAAHTRVPHRFENPADAEFAAKRADSDFPLTRKDARDHTIFGE